jgi:hypothetical protein
MSNLARPTSVGSLNTAIILHPRCNSTSNNLVLNHIHMSFAPHITFVKIRETSSPRNPVKITDQIRNRSSETQTKAGVKFHAPCTMGLGSPKERQCFRYVEHDCVSLRLEINTVLIEFDYFPDIFMSTFTPRQIYSSKKRYG